LCHPSWLKSRQAGGGEERRQGAPADRPQSTMNGNSVALALISVVIAACVSAAVWRYVRALQSTIQQLRQQIAGLERDRTARPAPRVAFEFNAHTREALLHVTNDGGDAEVRAPLSIEGALATQMAGEVSAVWSDGEGGAAMIRRGETHTLRLARLDLSVFPYAQWEIFVDRTAQDGPHKSVRAMHTSMIGGSPDTHAPAMFVQVALITIPEGIAPPAHCTVVLQPFEAVRLRPV
jgi:hypothetical protein